MLEMHPNGLLVDDPFANLLIWREVRGREADSDVWWSGESRWQ